MTVDVKRNPYSQRAIERVIKAVIACGLKVVAVRPDGTVLTEEVPEPVLFDEVADDLTDDVAQKPRDARKKLGVWR